MVQSAITSSPMRGTPSISSGRGKDGEGVEFGGDAVVEQLGSLDSCKKSLINDALNDFDDSTVFDNDRQRSVSSGTDEGFCVVDEIPGSGITNVGGEPRIRLLSDDVKLIDNWFEIPNEHYNDDILRLPSDFATPLIRYIVRDVSLLVHLYGGNDFGGFYGDKKRAPKTYSCEEFRYGYGPGQRLEADATGGVNRDHSVHVEIQLSKMSFVYQMFGADASILSMNLLTVHEIEMRDKLALSQINKMLYQ
ncbi:unnamed protein product, partial [Anisakis simplex]|uniref:Autophagy-related protein 2 n=1 Tax=Anisakis simplex TaxID=6269 RepID=A0A0M3JA69_ANISI